MPKDLYIANGFELDFDENGKIIVFNTVLYGKNNDGVLKNFVINYDEKESKEIKVALDKKVEAEYNWIKSLNGVIETIKAGVIENITSISKGEVYKMSYVRKPFDDGDGRPIQGIDESGGLIKPGLQRSDYVLRFQVIK